MEVTRDGGSPLSTAIAIEILLALIAAAIGVTSYLQAMRANREQVRMAAMQAKTASLAVDAEAYSRAKEIYEGALTTLRDELISTRREIRELRDSNSGLIVEIDNLRASNAGLVAEHARLRGEIASLRDEIARLHAGENKDS